MPRIPKVDFGRIYHKKYKLKDGSVAEQTNWTVRYQGKDHSTGSPDRKVAERLLLKLAGEATQKKQRLNGIEPNALVKDILQLVLDDYIEREKKSLPTTRIQVEKRLTPFFGHLAVGGVDTARIKAYKQHRLEQGVTKDTVDRELAILKRAFNLGYRHNPPLVDRVPYIEMFRLNNVRTGFLPREKYQALLEAMPEWLRCMFVVAYHVGDRKGELVNLRAEQVDLQAREIILYTGETKSGRGRNLPIYGDMLEYLDRQLATLPIGCQWVFHKKGRKIGDFRKTWRRACIAAGVPDLRFHDLRRTAARNLIRAGNSRNVAMKITGHLTESVFNRYDIVDPDDIREAGKKMDKYLNHETQERMINV